MKNMRVDDDGITFTSRDYEYFIDWSRIMTQLDLLEWIEHLCGKDWFTLDNVERLIQVACKKRGWNIYGNNA